MSELEHKPGDEFSPDYWYPLVSAAAIYKHKEPQAVLRRHKRSTEKMSEIAQAFEVRAVKPKAPLRELLYGTPLNLKEIPAETFVKFQRERLTVATHQNLSIASAAAEADKLSLGGLAGMSYSPKPDHEYYPADDQHVVYRFEDQEGFGVLLFNEAGQPGVFGVRRTKKRLNTGLSQVHGVGFSSPQNIQETLGYEFEDLRIPTNKPALIGFSSQTVTKTGEGAKEVEVCRLERIKYFQIF